MNKQKIILYYLLSILMTISGTAVAADVTLAPSVSVSWEQNDNIFLYDFYGLDDEGNREIDDEITTLSGGLLLRREGHRSDMGIEGKVSSVTYSENSDLDAVDYNARVFLTHDASRRFSWKIDSRYVVDNRPDRDLDVTGLVLDAEERESLSGSLSGTWIMGKKTSGTLGYSYYQSDYEKSNFNDATVHSVNLDIGRGLSSLVRETTSHLHFDASRYEYDFMTIDSYSAMVGFHHRIEKTLDVEFYIGARHTLSEYESYYAYYFEDSDSWGGVGELTFTYRGKRSTLSLSASRDIRTASGENGATERTSITASMRYRFLRDLSAGLSAGYYLNTADEGDLATRDIDRTTTRITPSITWHLTREISLEGSYTYTRIDRDEVYNRWNAAAECNRVLVTLSWTHDFVK